MLAIFADFSEDGSLLLLLHEDLQSSFCIPFSQFMYSTEPVVETVSAKPVLEGSSEGEAGRSLEFLKTGATSYLRELKYYLMSSCSFQQFVLWLSMSRENSLRKYLMFIQALSPTASGSNLNTIFDLDRNSTNSSNCPSSQFAISSFTPRTQDYNRKGTYSQQRWKQLGSYVMEARLIRCWWVRVLKKWIICSMVDFYSSSAQGSSLWTNIRVSYSEVDCEAPKGQLDDISIMGCSIRQYKL